MFLALLVAVPACSRGGDDSRKRALPAEDGAALPCGREAPTAEPHEGLASLGAFSSPEPDFTSLWLWGRRVAYTSGFEHVVVCDLERGKTTLVHTVDRSKKYLGTVRAHGDKVVWAEFDNPDRPDDPTAGAAWTIRVHDLRARRTTEIARGAPRQGFYTAPEPHIEDSVVIWLDLPPGDPTEQGPQLVSYHLATRARRVLAAETFPFSPRVTGGEVYFSAKSDKGRDLYAVAADGSSGPRRLTFEGGVDEIDARNGWVTWARLPVEHDPNRTMGDLSIVVLRVGSTATRVVATGRRPVAGNGFVVVDSVETAAAMMVVRADGSDQWPLVAEGGPEWTAGWSVDGDRIAWATVDDPERDRKPAYLRLGRLVGASS